jgi:esterase/lipase superfamily enzyme
MAVEDRHAVVFLHGYNVSFEEAALRTAQIGFDLKIQGPMAFFSWPSRGSLSGYMADESAIEASEDCIAEYLLSFAQHVGAEKVHVIAHSMGNRGLLRAIQRILAAVQPQSPVKFGHFILAAPDIDRDLFLKLAALYQRVSRRTTLYVSPKDRALAASRWLRAGYTRVGLPPPVTVINGIDTVHVESIPLDLLGHGYVAAAAEVLTDIFQIFTHDSPPERRMRLRQIQLEAGWYWHIGA